MTKAAGGKAKVGRVPGAAYRYVGTQSDLEQVEIRAQRAVHATSAGDFSLTAELGIEKALGFDEDEMPGDA